MGRRSASWFTHGVKQWLYRREASLEAACMLVTTHCLRALRPRAYRRSSGPVVTWGTPPRSEGCRSANQGFALTLMTVVRTS